MCLPSPILLICTGNLCRSPFAAHYMQRCIEQIGAGAETFSRGLVALPGQRPPPTAQKVAKEFGIDLSTHVAQPLLGLDLERAGLVLVMEPSQRQRIGGMRPAAIGKVFLLSHAAPPPLTDTPVTDPMGRSEEDFRHVYAQIKDYVEAWVQRLAARAG